MQATAASAATANRGHDSAPASITASERFNRHWAFRGVHISDQFCQSALRAQAAIDRRSPPGASAHRGCQEQFHGLPLHREPPGAPGERRRQGRHAHCASTPREHRSGNSTCAGPRDRATSTIWMHLLYLDWLASPSGGSFWHLSVRHHHYGRRPRDLGEHRPHPGALLTPTIAPPHDRDSPARGGGSETQLAPASPGSRLRRIPRRRSAPFGATPAAP